MMSIASHARMQLWMLTSLRIPAERPALERREKRESLSRCWCHQRRWFGCSRHTLLSHPACFLFPALGRRCELFAAHSRDHDRAVRFPACSRWPSAAGCRPLRLLLRSPTLRCATAPCLAAARLAGGVCATGPTGAIIRARSTREERRKRRRKERRLSNLADRYQLAAPCCQALAPQTLPLAHPSPPLPPGSPLTRQLSA